MLRVYGELHGYVGNGGKLLKLDSGLKLGKKPAGAWQNGP
jgi:hypothetical protein